MSLEDIIKNLSNPKKFKFGNTGKTYEQILKTETKRFKRILQRKIDNYYNSYEPVVYERREDRDKSGLRKSLTVDNIVKVSANGRYITCEITINENSIHQSLFGGEDADVFWLMNSGWSVKKNVWFKDIYRFGFYEGAHFLEEAIEEFESTNKYGIKVMVERPSY